MLCELNVRAPPKMHPVRPLHGVLAYVLFLTILLHLAAALYHAWVRRDGVFGQMARGERGG